MFSFKQIKKELNQLFNKKYLTSELARLKKEMMDLDAYKKIKEPTQKHLNQLEKQYRDLFSKITKKQFEVEKEFNKAALFLKKQKKEAEVHIRDLQKRAISQKKSVEKIIKEQVNFLGLGSTTRRKTAAKKKTTRKKTTRRKTTKKKTK